MTDVPDDADVSGRRAEIVEFITCFTVANSYAPTIREIAKGVGLRSTDAVAFHLERLRGQGKVTWVKGRNRTLRVIVESVKI